MNPFAAIGRVVIAFVALTGRLAMFTADAISHCVRPPIYWFLIVQQMLRVGYFSLPVVGLTAFFTGAVLFQVVTLPVEFNASSRALAQLTETGAVMPGEVAQAKQVLDAAALTYVAAAAMAALQLLRLILIRNSRN